MSARQETHLVIGEDTHRGFVVAHSTAHSDKPIVTAAFGAEFGDNVRIVSYDPGRLARLLRQLADALEGAAITCLATGERVDVELVAEVVPA